MLAQHAPADSWEVTQFHGNFNPGTKSGQLIFLEKTKGLPAEKSFELIKCDAPAMKQQFKARQGVMGDVVRKVAISFDVTGAATDHMNLLARHASTWLDNVMHVAQKGFATAVTHPTAIPAPPFTARNLDPANSDPDQVTFYDRVNLSVFAKIIENGLNQGGWDDLMLNKDKFSFLDALTGKLYCDGLTMLKIMFDQVDLENLKISAEKCKTS